MLQKFLEKALMITNNIEPVAIVFAKSATPLFPFDKFSPIIPDPITTETKKNVPISSQVSALDIFIAHDNQTAIYCLYI